MEWGDLATPSVSETKRTSTFLTEAEGRRDVILSQCTDLGPVPLCPSSLSTGDSEDSDDSRGRGF